MADIPNISKNQNLQPTLANSQTTLEISQSYHLHDYSVLEGNESLLDWISNIFQNIRLGNKAKTYSSASIIKHEDFWYCECETTQKSHPLLFDNPQSSRKEIIMDNVNGGFAKSFFFSCDICTAENSQHEPLPLFLAGSFDGDIYVKPVSTKYSFIEEGTISYLSCKKHGLKGPLLLGSQFYDCFKLDILRSAQLRKRFDFEPGTWFYCCKKCNNKVFCEDFNRVINPFDTV